MNNYELGDEWYEKIFNSFDGYIETDNNGYETGNDQIDRVRFDWTISKLNKEDSISEGLYLIETFNVPDEVRARIVSRTCHQG